MPGDNSRISGYPGNFKLTDDRPCTVIDPPSVLCGIGIKIGGKASPGLGPVISSDGHWFIPGIAGTKIFRIHKVVDKIIVKYCIIVSIFDFKTVLG